MTELPDGAGSADPAPIDTDAVGAAEEEKWPVLFMLTVAMAALYVSYRIVQMIWWGIDRLF